MNTRLLQPSVILDLGHCSAIDGIGETERGITLAAMVRQASADIFRLTGRRAKRRAVFRRDWRTLRVARLRGMTDAHENGPKPAQVFSEDAVDR